MRVTIAGASGFVGSNLIEHLKGNDNLNITALSRSEKKTPDTKIHWKKLDLFSMTSSTKAFENTDVAVYLVHSMVPSSRLFQGNFYDTDLLLADNFVRACIKNKVKHIIYLGGLLPEGKISPHLKSRIEVEDVIKNSGIDYTILRSGLVVGDQGSSFKILKNLVYNLPVMILPKWTQASTQIIHIDDLVRLFDDFIGNEEFKNKTINSVTTEKLIYVDLIKELARWFKKKRLYVSLPINITSFSKLWVTLFGRSNYSLVSPLIDSLTCDFSKVKPEPTIQNKINFKTYKQMLKTITPPVSERKERHRKLKKIRSQNRVQSIQRLSEGLDGFGDILEISNAYCTWLTNYLGFMVNVNNQNTKILFTFFLIKKPLIVLELNTKTLTKTRAKYSITDGLLVSKKNTGSLEFRFIAEKKYLLCYIHNFVPSLPWYIYKFTQAKFHAFVMSQFSKYLRSNIKKHKRA